MKPLPCKYARTLAMILHEGRSAGERYMSQLTPLAGQWGECADQLLHQGRMAWKTTCGLEFVFLRKPRLPSDTPLQQARARAESRKERVRPYGSPVEQGG